MKGENSNTQRKRKNTSSNISLEQDQEEDVLINRPTKYQQLDLLSDESNPRLDLSLAVYIEPNSLDSKTIDTNPTQSTIILRPPQARRNPTRIRPEGQGAAKSEMVQPPYPWAMDRRAKVHTMQYLLDIGILTISGEVQCKKCERSYTLEYDLREKFEEIVGFVIREQDGWHDRAPKEWVDYKLPTCKFCGEEKSCKPLLAEKKKSINWLFLLLGQLLGCCTLEQLKYFCKHTNIHRTGAKNRVLLYTYLALCKQLQPNGPFHYQTI